MSRHRGEGSIFRRGRIYWCAYYHAGRRVQESTHSASEREAVRFLRQRLGEIGASTYIGPKAEAVRFDDLTHLLETHYALRERRSTKRMQQGVARLAERFAGQRAVHITAARLLEYQVHRRKDAAAATVAYELALLRKAFSLAVDTGLIPRGPRFPSLAVSNARQGFFEHHELEAVCRELPPALVPVARFAYLTGWRRGEIVGLTWDRVDFDAGIIRLDVGTTKNRDGRSFPMDALPALVTLLREQQSYTGNVEAAGCTEVPWVFHRFGHPIRDMHTAWRAACVRAKVPGRLLHDFRRTAVRNLERAGVPRSVAMQLTGHKTEAVYRRYAIVVEADLRDGVAKLHRMLATEQLQSAS